jgi:hypothetical protein
MKNMLPLHLVSDLGGLKVTVGGEVFWLHYLVSRRR